MKKAKIAFLGAGNMARSIIAGLVNDYDPNLIWAADRNTDKLTALETQYRINTDKDVLKVTELVDIVILSVKPQSLPELAHLIAPIAQKKHPLMISIAAGITTQDLNSWLGHKTAIVRAMPNTPALIQAGATGLYANANVSKAQRDMAESIMRSVGVVAWVEEEHLIDAVIAIAGSAPAYYFLFMEILQSLGESMGLDAKTAYLLTLQGAYGSTKLALETGTPLKDLRAQVTSKGGTTEAALNSFAKDDVHALFKHAVEACRQRSVELSKQFGAQRQLS